ncbi:hypothetical protein [Nonomuraea sp. NPDC052265]|uniref:hypothetical protein n=1 Tax=Nonomuraea sp. NPDC052265 TaxID=3364374 RepID=UPI0037CBAE9F
MVIALVVLIAVISVWGYSRRCRALGEDVRARRAATGAALLALAAVLTGLGVLLYQKLQRPPTPAPKAIYTCRYAQEGDEEGVCAGVDDGMYVEFRATPDHPKLLDGTHEVSWASSSAGLTACQQTHQFLFPLLEVAATELEGHRPLNLGDVAMVLTQGEAKRLMVLCRATQPLNNVLALVVEGVVLHSSGQGGADQMDTMAANLRDYLAGG